MAIIDTLRPTATLSDAGWIVTPSGAAYAVTADNSDSTYVTGNFDSSVLSLSVGTHGVAADHMRHLARVRARGEDGDIIVSVLLPSGSQVAYSAITLPAAVTTVNGSWGAGLPPSASGSYGITVTPQGSNIDITELYLDIDSRAKPTFTVSTLDAGVAATTITSTNTPTILFSSIDLDGLPPRQWRAWVTQGSTIVWDSGNVAGAASSVDTSPLVNGSYTLHAQIWSTVGSVNEFASSEVTQDFIVNVQPVVGPTSISAVQRTDTPLFDITVGIPSGLGDYDNHSAYVEVQRTDCDGNWSTISLDEVSVDRTVEDFENSAFTVTVTGSGDASWVRDSTRAHGGEYSYKSGIIVDSETSGTIVYVPAGAHTLTYWYSVSSEDGFDFFVVYADATPVLSVTGEIDWTQDSFSVVGVTYVEFKYEKDSSASSGSDAAWIDDLTFIGAADETVTVVDWTAPRAVNALPCETATTCEFEYRARLVGLSAGQLVTSEWMYETTETASALWQFNGGSREPTTETNCDAQTLLGGWLYVTGGAGSYMSTPDDVSIDVTGDIDVRAFCGLPDWTPATNMCVIGKYTTGGNQRSWFFAVYPGGVMRFVWSSDGTSGGAHTFNSSALNFTDDTAHWIRVTRDAATGDVTFYTSVDGYIWTQHGAVQAGTAGSMFNSSAALTVGGRSDGEILTGKVYYAELRSGIDGTVVANPNFRNAGTGATSFVDTAGRTWTINGTAMNQRLVIGGSVGYATDPVLICSTFIPTTLSGTVFFAMRIDETSTTFVQLRRVAFLAARASAATPRGFMLYTSIDGYETPVYSAAIPTERPTFTSFDIALNIPITGTGIDFRVNPYTISGLAIEFDNIEFTFGAPVMHSLSWPVDTILVRTRDASGPLWYSACGDVTWNTERPFTTDLDIMGNQRVRSASIGGRDYTLVLGVTSQTDVETLETIFGQQLVLVSPADVPEQWVAPIDQSTTPVNVGRVRTTTIKTIGTGPEPAHSALEVAG